MSIVHTTKSKFPKLKQKYRMQLKIWPECGKLPINVHEIIDTAVLVFQKRPQCAIHHTRKISVSIQTQKTAKVTAWRRQFS